MNAVLLTHDEALDVLVALDEGADHALFTGALALLVLLQDAASILIDKLFPDLPAGA